MLLPLRKTNAAPTAAELEVLALYETIALVANDLTAAADSIYAAHLMHASPTENVLATVRSAANRAIAAIDACGGR